MPLPPDQFRTTMGRLVAGVTVIGVRDEAGQSRGMTASAITALSLEPPMLLVCIDRKAAIHDVLVKARTFSVSILAEDQEPIARRFAELGRHDFEDGDGPSGPFGLPSIADALAHLECARGPVFGGGDHSIITGTLEWARARDGAPLCHYRSTYSGLRP